MPRPWRSNTSPTTQRFLTIISVVCDYIIIGCALFNAIWVVTDVGGDSVLVLGSLLFISNQRPRQQTFSVLDPTISFPFIPGDTISVGVSKGHPSECELTATYTNLANIAICTINCSPYHCHSPVVLIPSEWLIQSTGLDIQLQSAWPG